jgi:UDP-2-acetamido-2,6-beta-L-arabino-hexul-4-ose reductase
MKVLVTGSKGFIGKNFISVLRNHSEFEILEFDLPQTLTDLEQLVLQADIVFHLAGVNRPKGHAEFKTGNIDLTEQLLQMLAQNQHTVPVVITSSIQATMDNPYGESKRAAEQLVLHYGREHQQRVYVFRLANVFGKWSKPNYNSVVATFCYNLAHGLSIQVNPAPLKLVYIDDVVKAFMRILQGEFAIADDGYSYVEPVLHTSVQQVADILQEYLAMRKNLQVPDDCDLLRKYLYATLISFFPPAELTTDLTVHADQRGSFMELVKDVCAGQVSVNKTNPGQTKGNHWHQTLIERFCNISGEIVFRTRKVGETIVSETFLSGDNPQVIEVPPGVVHNFTNISDTEAITMIWASEMFDADNADVVYETV